VIEKRKSKRHRKRVAVKYGIERPEKNGVTEDISEGGMFIRASHLYPPATKLRIELQSDGLARMDGEVRWVREISPIPMPGTEGGMGIMVTGEKEEVVGKEEISSVTEVMQAMAKASNALRMYMSNNPLLQRFLEDLNGKMDGHLEGYGDLRLDIDHFEMRYKGKVVYENRDPKESMAFKMYSDGIRSIIFSEGIEGEEVGGFLDIMGRDSTGGVDDDIVTLLWERDLPHITYILAEDYLEFDASGTGPAPVATLQENIKSLYSEMPNTLTAAPMVIPQNILTLSEREMERLRNAREAEEKRNPVEEVINILSSILFAEKDFATFGRFVDITVKMIGNLIHSGEVDYAMCLIRFLRGLSESEKLSPYHLDRLRKAMEGTVSGEIINDLGRIIDTTEKIGAKGLRELLLLFGKTAIRQICELLAVVEKRDMRRVVLDTLVEIGRDTPEAFFPSLTDSRWHMVRNAVYILRMIGSPSAVEPVSKLIYHGEPQIRREVFLCLAGIPETKAKAYLVKFLQDKESAMRINAINALAGSGFKEALKPIMEIVASKEFEKKEMPEKKALFEALGRLGSDDVVPMLRDMLMKRYWFNREKEKEQALLAVSGLRRAGTDPAIKTLEEAAARKRGDVKGIINQALKSISAEVRR
jgi:hypothetical protein